MADDAAKKHALLIMGVGKPAKGDAGPDDDYAPKSDELESSAIDDMWDAIESKDKEAFGGALKRYVDACVAKSEADESGEE